MAIRNIVKIKSGSWIFEAFDVSLPKINTTVIEGKASPASLDEVTRIFAGKKSVEFSFSTYLKKLGSEGSLEPISDLIKATGFKLTEEDTDADSTNDTFIYTPADVSDAITTPDFEILIGDNYYMSILDCAVKSLKLSFKAGEPVIATFDLVGVFDSESMSGTITGNYDVKEPFKVSSLIVGSAVPQNFETFELTITNTLAERVDPTTDNIITGFIITKRTIEASIDPEFATLYNTEDVLNPFSIFAGTSNDSVKIEGSNVVVESRELGDRNGLVTSPLKLRFLPSSVGANDSITITFVKKS